MCSYNDKRHVPTMFVEEVFNLEEKSNGKWK